MKEYIGCGDSGCWLEKPKGQATNGGCRCFPIEMQTKDKLKFKKALQRKDQELLRLRELLKRYRNETPLGNQPHMIAHEVDQALQSKEEAKFGGWYICGKCNKKVTNGEECKNCNPIKEAE